MRRQQACHEPSPDRLSERAMASLRWCQVSLGLRRLIAAAYGTSVCSMIQQSAVRLCDALFSVVYLYDGVHLRVAATKNFTPEATSQIYGRPELKRPDRSHTGGRAILDRAVVHIHDVLEDPEYSREFALAGAWRAVLGGREPHRKETQ
jgi:hypothetical protein